MCPSKTPALAATPAPVQIVIKTLTLGDDKKVKIKIVIKCVGRWDRREEARVELVHGYGRCGNRIKRLGDKMKVELLDAEGDELEGVERTKDIDHIESLEEDDANVPDLGACDIGDGTWGDTSRLGILGSIFSVSGDS
ncbi:hypothetical protein HG530_015696 [Fusarium avenaceum]|nr:hypothetical protein HG530_015696 [Fusarium avenaceum]